MNISIIGTVFPYKGGISHFNNYLIDALNQEHAVNVISWKKRYPRLLYPGSGQIYSEHAHLMERDNRFILKYYSVSSWFTAFKKIQNFESDILIFNWMSPLLAPILFFICYLVKKKLACKIVAICHNVDPHEKRMLDAILTKWVFRKVDHFIVHGRSEVSKLEVLIPKAKILIQGIPPYTKFKEIQQPRDLKKKLNLGNRKVVLYFGIIRPYKGVDILLNSIPDVLREIEIDFLIVGEVWDDRKKYDLLIEKLDLSGKIHFINSYIPDDEVGNYFQLADLVVLPYKNTSQSAVAQIAIAYNKPIISTAVGGLIDLAATYKNLTLVRSDDPHELANAIVKFFTTTNRSLSEEPINFSWHSYADAMLRMVQDN